MAISRSGTLIAERSMGEHVAVKRRHAAATGLIIGLLASSLFGCGYQFHVGGAGATIGGSSAPKADAPRLRIVPFENMTFEPNIELRYTTYVHREFSQASGARVVNDGEPADLILKGKITSVSYPTINFSLQGTFEGRTTANVTVTVEDAKTGKKVWTQSVAASSEFFLTDDLQFNRVLQTRAVEQAGRLIAADLAMRFQQFLDLRHRPTPASVPPASGPPNGALPSDKPGAGGVPAK